MSRYTILILLNAPFVIAGIMNALVAYKLGKTSRRRFLLRVFLWLVIFAGLLFAEPIYAFLFSNNLTETEPLSLFDVIQITGVIVTFYVATQAYGRVDQLEQRVKDLHEELSIRMAQTEKTAKKTRK